MAKKKQRESAATKSTMVLRSRTPVATKSTIVRRPRTLTAKGEKVKGKNTVASEKKGTVDSGKGEIVRKRKVMADRRKTKTAENIVKRVETLNKNEMDKGQTNGRIRILRSNCAKKGAESRKKVDKKGTAKDKTNRLKRILPAKKEPPLATRSLKPKRYICAKKEAPLTIRSPKPKKNSHAIGSTMVLRPRTSKGKREMPVKVDGKTKEKMLVEVNKKTDGKKPVAGGKIKMGNAVRIGTAVKRKFTADKGNTEVARNRVKKLKVVIKKNEMDKTTATGSTRVFRSNRANKGDESGKKDVKKGSPEAKTKKLKKNLLGKKEAPLTVRGPNLKKKILVKKKASSSSTISSPKPKKNIPAKATKGIAKKCGKLEDPLSKEKAKDTIANNHRNVYGFKNQESGTKGKDQLIKTKKTKIVVTKPVFPPEIIMEILSWLPVKFFGTPMVVCKEWYALIQDRHFIEKQMNRNISDIESKVREGYKRVYALDGLKLEQNISTQKYCIRNPDTRQFLELPDPDPHSGMKYMFFVYVPVTLNYKIVVVYDDDDNNNIICCDLSRGNDELSWRLLSMPTRDYPKSNRKKFFIRVTGDVVHCIRVIASGDDMVEEVVSLDLGTEQFFVTNLPKGQYKRWEEVWFINFKGKPALVDIVGAQLCVLVLENYKKQKWGKKESLVPVELMKKLQVKHGTVSPETVDGFERLWFWLGDAKKYVSYDIKTKQICSKHGHIHGLVRLKGMQLE